MKAMTKIKLGAKHLTVILLLLLSGPKVFGQDPSYQVYALKFASLNFKIPISKMAVGSTGKDSTGVCYMVYLLKGNNGKMILVDAGFTEPIKPYPWQAFTYTRPDSMLRKMNINPADITDVIITHPHWDHIGGMDLFPNAMIWMQMNDYNYFVGAAWQKGENPDNGFNPIDVTKIVQRNLNGKLTLIKGDSVEIMPGIRAFIGSKHTFESQYVFVGTGADRLIIASDNSWLYYNLTNLFSIPVTLDQKAYLKNLKRMIGMVKNVDLIIPGHDPLVFSKFLKVSDGIVRIK